MNNINEIFGSLVFNDNVMKARLPENTYVAFKKAISEDKSLEKDVAEIIAGAMKDWAIENGATHFTHWFQPLTGITAEKHDSFITPDSNGGAIMEFSGKELIKGEPDASSFPSGGLRSTFEARGYTAWDPTSYAFIKDNTLCIPTAFCSYGGEALDKKTPLLRSMEVINSAALRVLRALGDNETSRVETTVGAEQEYFLIDRDLYNMRKDLVFTGRTLFGSRPPKGQEMDDHYFGAIKSRVKAFMKELNEELWKLGVLAKTEHNEVAPGQHELAPIFTTTNIATDQNQLTMEMMKKVAAHHGLTCLLHEKPFAGVNGSGKHNNWSLITDKGVNLLNPGKKPEKNYQFMLFLCAVICAVDDYQDMLRISVASAGNDHRLGANEAPPAIVSMFLGDTLLSQLITVADGSDAEHTSRKEMEIGVHVLPHFKQDTTDRNRTSPFAFTGNKFEFRMLGSAFSIAGPNIVLNTIVADALDSFAIILESSADKTEAIRSIVRDTMKKHSRIIFNGNNYSDEWKKEAKERGLLNISTTVEAIPYYVSEKNISLFTRHKIFTESEMHSRCEVLLENYSKTINIEAETMLDMSMHDIIPAISAYIGELSNNLMAKRSVCPDSSDSPELHLINTLTTLNAKLYHSTEELRSLLEDVRSMSGVLEIANFYANNIIPKMEEIRESSDCAELYVSSSFWPMPTYAQLMFSVE